MWSRRVNGPTTSSRERVPQGTGHTGEFAEKLISLEEMRVSRTMHVFPLSSCEFEVGLIPTTMMPGARWRYITGTFLSKETGENRSFRLFPCRAAATAA